MAVTSPAVSTPPASAGPRLLALWRERNGRYVRLKYYLTEAEIQAAIDWRRGEAEALPQGIERVRALTELASWRPITNLNRR